MSNQSHSQKLVGSECQHFSISAFQFFALGLLLAGAASAWADVHYVDLNCTNATPPYTNWATAATSIQEAVDAAVAGDEVVVTNGTYATGYRTNDSGQNRVLVDKPLSVRSVNGPQFTIIQGYGAVVVVRGGGRIYDYVRCAYLTSGASLSGFTLTGGYAYAAGGGAYGGTVNNCTLSGNAADAHAQDDFDVASAQGGGAFECVLNNCTLNGNKASANYDLDWGWAWMYAQGGGACNCLLNNCTLINNTVSVNDFFGEGGALAAQCAGGGASGSALNNCTLVNNSASAPYGGVALGGGADDSSRLSNCITFMNYSAWRCEDCGSPGGLASGNNWRGDPLFVDTNAWANLRLQSNSPCINAGNNYSVTNATDLDGNPRIAGGTVDIGAYEFQAPLSMISYAWLEQYGLPINSSTDTADPDGDAVDNYHEWLANSDPTNPFSFPPLLTLIPYGPNINLTWTTNAFGFTLQTTTDPGSSSVWQTNSPAPVVIGGQNVVVNPLSGAQEFYRLVH